MYPTLKHERRIWDQGRNFIAGVDEVGRGALAGPVVAAAVALPKLSSPPLFQVSHTRKELRIQDSKKLTPRHRKILAKKIKKLSLAWAVGQASVRAINKLGIVKATHRAMRRAVRALPQAEFVLVDAFTIPYLKNITKKNQKALKDGDQRCLSIAAASIVAKVHRDNLMTKLGERFPDYHLHKHKGYGTFLHRQAILTHGAQKFHRQLFIRNYI